ncbi:hypothetical protein HJC23_000649, partial [Cyclotella cryptica]
NQRTPAKAKAKGPSVVTFAKGLILTAIVVVALLQFFALHRYSDHRRKEQWHDQGSSFRQVGLRREHDGSSDRTREYIMWSKDESYFSECKQRFIRNETWGELHAPYVDKVQAKEILAKSNVPDLRIIPTLAILDKDNISSYSLEFMRSIPQPYIIKASHVSGGVARVFNNTYHCFKYCNNAKVLPLDNDAFTASQQQIDEDINTEYEKFGGETQYKYIKPRIIFEEDIISGGKTQTDVTYWWLTNGKPVFISHQCGERKENQQGFQMKRIFLSTDFRRLPIIFNRDTCDDVMLDKPKSWDTQLQVATDIGKLFPAEVVRLDLYGGGEMVWLSEFTFTTGGCWKTFKPRVTDGFLYAVAHGKIPTESVTAEYVQKLLSGDSWVVVSYDEKGEKLSTFSGAYPSPVDMCMVLEDFFNPEQKYKRTRLYQSCIKESQKLSDYPVRCIITQSNASMIQSFGSSPTDLVDGIKHPTNIDICTSKYRTQFQVRA